MIKKTVYLTERQNSELEAIAKSTGKNTIDLISEAIDRFIDQVKREMILQKAAGMWKDKIDFPGFKETRKEWDR